MLPISCFRSAAAPPPPNILVVLTDDQRHDALGCAGGALPAVTPAMDRLAARGVRFRNAFVVSAVSGASRAAALTGLYGSVNGVSAPGYGALRGDAVPFAIRLRDAGWRTGMAGAWHFAAPPEEAGFDAAAWFPARSPGRPAATGGGERAERDVARTAAEAVRFLAAATNDARPFLFWMAPELPDAKPGDAGDAAFPVDRMPVPATWNDDLTSRPAYLTTARQRIQARAAGLDSPDAIRRHVAAYLEGVRAMDAAVGRVLDALDRLKLADRTVVILAGGGGRFLGEHGFAGNLLPYEEAIRMPLIVAGPGVRTGIEDRLVLNVDLGATVPALAGLPVDPSLHGRSLLPLLHGTPPAPEWRDRFLYEVPATGPGSRPLWAVRTDRWKYVRTEDPREPGRVTSEELYDLSTDPCETNNLSPDRRRQPQIGDLDGSLRRFQVDLERDRSRRRTPDGR